MGHWFGSKAVASSSVKAAVAGTASFWSTALVVVGAAFLSSFRALSLSRHYIG